MTTTIVDRELEPRDPATHDQRSGVYIIPRRWHLHLPWDQAVHMDFNSIPGLPIPNEWSFQHPGSPAVVTMKAVARSAEYLKQDESNLKVTYEGHLCMWPDSTGATTTAGTGLFNGVIAGRFEQGTRSEHMLVSYDCDDQGKRKGIGAYGEGTNRLAPTCRWLITQNLSESDYGWMSNVIQDLIGLVNEEDWTDPVFGNKWAEEVWLYLGPHATQNRDGTYTLVHQFDYDLQQLDAGATTAASPIWFSHRYPWHFVSDEIVEVESAGGVRKTVKRAVGSQQLSRIYRTAGSGVLNGRVFADLFRPVSA
jgi:hypothetical protein